MRESEKWSRSVAQSCLTLSDPMNYSLPGSSIHGIFQARVLEWGAIAFSNMNMGFTEKEIYVIKKHAEVFSLISYKGKIRQ